MSGMHDENMDRRDVLCGGGAALFGTMLASLLGDAKTSARAGLAGPVPVVDGLTVRVVIDSYQFAAAPSSDVDGVVIERFGWGRSRAMNHPVAP